MEEEVDLGDSLGLMFGVEEVVENKLSGEDEVLELELDGLPVYEEVEESDPDGDRAYFDALLEDEPKKMINLTQTKRLSVGIIP
ncbi:hypothetical protein Hanom_Chr10g00949131 [Helianthus anomalus]